MTAEAPQTRRPPRIRGRRYLLADVDGQDRVWVHGLFRSPDLAGIFGRDLPGGVIVDVEADEANRIARSPWARRGGHIDENTLAERARSVGIDWRTLRSHLAADTAKGRGRLARLASADLSNLSLSATRSSGAGSDKMTVSATAPDGMADLLADALAAVLGPNAAVFRDRPRDWRAIEAAAREIAG